jgi:hypothetical protein
MTPFLPPELVFQRSIARTAGLLAGSLLITGVSYFFLTHRVFDIAFEAWLLGLMLGPVAIVINSVSLFRGGPQVIFDEHGIHDLRTSWGLIPWSDVLSVAIIRFYASRYLCLYLVDESDRIARLSTWGRLALRANHVRGFPAFKIRFIGLTPGLDDAWAYLQTHRPEKVCALPAPQVAISGPL